MSLSKQNLLLGCNRMKTLQFDERLYFQMRCRVTYLYVEPVKIFFKLYHSSGGKVGQSLCVTHGSMEEAQFEVSL